MRRCSFLLGAIAVLAGLVAPTGAAAAEPSFGLNAQEYIRNHSTPADWPLGFQRLAALGVDTARTDFFPDDDPAWQDRVVGELARVGIRVRAVVIDRHAHPSSADAAFFAHARRFAERYAVGGSFWRDHPELPNLPVEQIEVWNEPNTARHWLGPVNAGNYWALFDAARDEIESVSPATKVLLGGLAWDHIDTYVLQLWEASGRAWDLDGIGFHPWGDVPAAVFANVRKLNATLRQIGQGHLPLYLTEIGWLFDDANPSRQAKLGGTRDTERAGVQALTIDTLTRSDCNVHGIDVYDFVEPAIGLVTQAGVVTAAGRAYTDSIRRWAPGQPSLALCSPAVSDGPRLSLGLTASQDAEGCQMPTLTYEGHPIEDGVLYARGSDATGSATGFASGATVAAGTARLCGAVAKSARVRVWGHVRGVAQSPVLTCAPSLASECAPARIRVSATTVTGGTPVVVDASDHAPAHFRWDTDGDGTYETDGGASPRLTVTFNRSGSRRVGVLVEQEGRRDTDDVTLEVTSDAAGLAVVSSTKVPPRCATQRVRVIVPSRARIVRGRVRIRARLDCWSLSRGSVVSVYRVRPGRRPQLLKRVRLGRTSRVVSLRTRGVSRARLRFVVKGVRYGGRSPSAETFVYTRR